MVRQRMLKFGELSMSKVNELKLLSSSARAVADGRDFLDIEVLGGGLISLSA